MAFRKDRVHTQADLDSHGINLNPNNDAYYTSRGYPSSKRVLTQAENDNRSRQLNEQDELYWKLRGY